MQREGDGRAGEHGVQGAAVGVATFETVAAITATGGCQGLQVRTGRVVLSPRVRRARKSGNSRGAMEWCRCMSRGGFMNVASHASRLRDTCIIASHFGLLPEADLVATVA